MTISPDGSLGASLVGRIGRWRRARPHAASSSKGSKLAKFFMSRSSVAVLFIVRELFRIERFADRFADVGDHQVARPS